MEARFGIAPRNSKNGTASGEQEQLKENRRTAGLRWFTWIDGCRGVGYSSGDPRLSLSSRGEHRERQEASTEHQERQKAGELGAGHVRRSIISHGLVYSEVR